MSRASVWTPAHARGSNRRVALSIEEKYDEVRQLITMGKEKGYLLYEEVNDMLPSEISSSDDLDDIFSMFGSMGIEVVDSEQKFREPKEGEEGAGARPHPRRAGQDQRPRPHVPARDGDGAPADPRGRGRDRQAHRAGQEGRAQGHHPHARWRRRRSRGWPSACPRARSASVTRSSSSRKKSPTRSSRTRSARPSSSRTRSRPPTPST